MNSVQSLKRQTEAEGNISAADILFLTTDLGCGGGGIQKSGLEAVHSFLHLTRRHVIEQVRVLTYLSHDKSIENKEFESISANGSKIRAFQLAVMSKWNPKLLLCWHISLLPVAALIRKRETKVLVFLHGIECWRKLHLWVHLSARCVNEFLSNSDFTWNRFIRYNPQYTRSAHSTVALGLGDGDQPSVPLTLASQSPPAALILGRISANEDYKGHRELIEAWPLVLKKISKAELWIAGDGDLRGELERMVRSKGLGKHILFWGQVSEKTKISLLQKCRCLAMPSKAEGFGLVYLEAMRLGRPCLVSDRDAGQELVRPPECGLAANPEDIDILAGCLVRLLTFGEEWQQWSSKCRQRYLDHYTANHFQKRLLSACLQYL